MNWCCIHGEFSGPVRPCPECSSQEDKRSYTQYGLIQKTQEQSITEAAFDAAFAKVHQTNNARFDKRDRAQWDALKAFVCKL